MTLFFSDILVLPLFHFKIFSIQKVNILSSFNKLVIKISFNNPKPMQLVIKSNIKASVTTYIHATTYIKGTLMQIWKSLYIF